VIDLREREATDPRAADVTGARPVQDLGNPGEHLLGSAAMATHDVTMNLSHPITVMNVDVEFEVRSDGELMGKVQISRGGIDWMPFKSHPRAATWEQFAAWMEGTA
jgi:hypothetical protein